MAEVEPRSPGDNGADSSVLMRETAICLFAFAECADARRPHPPEATIERRLMLHCVGSVAALVGVVPIADYQGADSERHLSDIAWLAPRVRRHAELVAWMTQGSSVFPAPFGTLYSSLDNLTAFMRAHEATIAAFLRTVADKEEWELRAVACFDGPDALDRLACDAWPDWRGLSKGSRYMRLCRDKSALLDFGRADAAAFVRDFVAELRPFASDTRLLGLPRLPGPDEREPVARYALLMAKTGVAVIRDRVQEIAPRALSRHVAITLSGPWPPFSFRPHLNQPN
ncbi:MAG: GvpL/GvpF family gas vesicle protein [Roseiarcus sp.]|jgi:hypothetical protein